MKHLEVLVITKNTTTPRVLNWKVSTVNNVEIAIEKLQQKPYKVVVISTEIEAVDKLKLCRLIAVLFDHQIVVEYTDDKTLAETVKRAYWSKNRPGRSSDYLDNSFEIKLANSIHLK